MAIYFGDIKNDKEMGPLEVLRVNASGDDFETAKVVVSSSKMFYVLGNGTDSENGTELLNMYNYVKTLSPSSSNRLTIIVNPGVYEFDDSSTPGNSPFVIDTDYIDILSFTGKDDVILKCSSTGTDEFNFYAIKLTADNVYLKGLSCGIGNVDVKGTPTPRQYSFKMDGSGGFANIKLEYCNGGPNSFNPGMSATLAGTFINCTAAGGSFGYNGGILSGTFTNCTAGFTSFGYGAGTCSGTFTNCTAGVSSFANAGYCSGTFIDCIGEDYCFAYAGSATGTFIGCTAGEQSFGYGDTCSGKFTQCIGGANSFGGGTGVLSAKLYLCEITGSSYKTLSGSGKIYFSIENGAAVDYRTA